MTIVVDSSMVVAALVAHAPHGTWAEELVAGNELHAPDLLLVEVTNVLRRLELSNQLTMPEANAAREDLMQLQVELFPFPPFAERVWELRHSMTSYDASYVALAEALEFPLATLDDRLAKAPGPKCKFLLAKPR